MKVELLVMHREERYEGEYAPEVVAVCDEWTLEDNPKWWADEIAKQKSLHASAEDAGPGAARAWAVVTIELSVDSLMLALYPKMPVTSGLIVDSRKA